MNPVETIGVARDDDGLDPSEVLAVLAARGLRVIFIEGGGVTVTRWLERDLLDRLHLVVAPVLIGEGRPAIRLPSVATMAQALRPRCHVHRLGEDVLWDFDLRSRADSGEGG